MKHIQKNNGRERKQKKKFSSGIAFGNVIMLQLKRNVTPRLFSPLLPWLSWRQRQHGWRWVRLWSLFPVSIPPLLCLSLIATTRCTFLDECPGSGGHTGGRPRKEDSACLIRLTCLPSDWSTPAMPRPCCAMQAQRQVRDGGHCSVLLRLEAVITDFNLFRLCAIQDPLRVTEAPSSQTCWIVNKEHAREILAGCNYSQNEFGETLQSTLRWSGMISPFYRSTFWLYGSSTMKPITYLFVINDR